MGGVVLGSLRVESHLDLGEGEHLLGFEDGQILRVSGEGRPGRAVSLRIADAHPVRSLVRHRGTVHAAVLGKGIVRLEGRRWVRMRGGPRTRYVTDLAVIRGRLMVGTLYDGLWRMVRGRPIRTRLPASHVDRIERQGQRWVIRSAFGRFVRRGVDRFVRVGDLEPQLRSGGAMAVTLHRGRVFVGDFEQGVRRLDGDRLVPVPGAPAGDARARHVDALVSAGGHLYAGTESGLFHIRPKGWVCLLAASVHDLAVEPSSGRLLVASSRGLWALEDGALRRLDPANGSPRPAFSAVAAWGGGVYAGSLDGLYVLDGRGWRAIGPDEGFDGGWVTALAAHRGALYVGTYAEGVFSLGDGGRAARVPGLETMWVPFHALRGDGERLFVGGLGMAPRLLGSDGSVARLPVAARDANDALFIGTGGWVATNEGLRWLELPSVSPPGSRGLGPISGAGRGPTVSRSGS